MLSKLYNYLGRLIPMDVTKVLVWNIAQANGANENIDKIAYGDDYTVCVLSSSHLEQYVNDSQYELDAKTVSSLESNSVTCIGVFANERLAAYLFFCGSPVDPSNNSGGSPFYGIGLEFGTQVRYLYKVLVLPEQRGRHLSARMLRFAADYFGALNVDCLVTTTDWTNTAFLKASASVGFSVVGTAAEFIIFGKHVYRLPSPYAVSQGQAGVQSPDIDTSIADTASNYDTQLIRLLRP